MKEKASKTNQSLEKALRIIEYMSENTCHIRLQDLAKALDIPQSTALRFLNTLMQNGYVYQDAETLKYSLSMKICKLGYNVSSKIDIRLISRPYMENLAKQANEAVCLVVENNLDMVYIDYVDGPDKILKTLSRVGRTAPMHCTAAGKVHLTNYDSCMLNHLIQLKGLAPITKNTITTRENLVCELDKIRHQGYAVDDEECENGARCLAAPIYDFTGKIVGAISVSGSVSRMTDDKMENIKNILIDNANKITEKLS